MRCDWTESGRRCHNAAPMAEGRRGLPGDRPGGADPAPPRRVGRGSDARRRHGGHAAAEVDGRSSAAGTRAKRARAASSRRRLPARAGARRVRPARYERGRSRGARVALSRAARSDDGRDGERGHPDTDRRRPGRPGRQPPSARRWELGRQPHPDPCVQHGQGLHGVRRGAAARSAVSHGSARTPSRAWTPCSPSSTACGESDTRPRGRSSRRDCARRRPPYAARAERSSPRSRSRRPRYAHRTNASTSSRGTSSRRRTPCPTSSV